VHVLLFALGLCYLFEWHCSTRSSVSEIRLNTACTKSKVKCTVWLSIHAFSRVYQSCSLVPRFKSRDCPYQRQSSTRLSLCCPWYGAQLLRPWVKRLYSLYLLPLPCQYPGNIHFRWVTFIMCASNSISNNCGNTQHVYNNYYCSAFISKAY